VTAPTDESYWVTPDVLAGKYPGAKLDREAVKKLNALLDAGVRTFVDLTEGDELLPYAHHLPHDVTHHRVAVADVTCPSVEQVRTALQILHGSRDGDITYLHCRGGCGRTGVIVGCYLVETGLAPEDALARVHELTRVLWSKPCPETPEQIEMVATWKTLP
jgi:protein-tyrosine phosphatase